MGSQLEGPSDYVKLALAGFTDMIILGPDATEFDEMPRYFALGYAAIAAMANALQVPGHWDIFDVGALIMVACATYLLIFGE